MEQRNMETGVAEAVASVMGDDQDGLPVPEEAQANEEVGIVNEDDSTDFDPTSPEARHWQSVADRRIAKIEAETRARLSKLEQQQATQKLKETRTSPSEAEAPDIDEVLQINVASMPNIPAGELADYMDENILRALDQRIAQIVRWGAGESVRSIAAYNQKAAAQHQQQEVQKRLTGFISTLESGQAEAFMPLYTQYQNLAETDPDGFIEFAKVKLGMVEKPKPQARQNLASAVQASSTRPTTNGRTQARVAQPKSVREGVEAAVAQALKRSGG